MLLLLAACNSTPTSETPSPAPTVTTPDTTDTTAAPTATVTATATESPPPDGEAEAGECGCQSDSDCVKVSPGCCKCNAGGNEIAIAKSCMDKIKPCAQQGVMCPQVYKCTDRQAKCVSGECQLSGDGGAPKVDIK